MTSVDEPRINGFLSPKVPDPGHGLAQSIHRKILALNLWEILNGSLPESPHAPPAIPVVG
jgi:hypothetical protein